MSVKYLLGIIVSVPLLPLLYWQGKRIRQSVPVLPEAKNPEGLVVKDKSSNKVFRIVCLGESTMAGVGVKTHEEGFAGSLAKEVSDLLNMNVSWHVHARSGYTVELIKDRLVTGISEKRPDIIFIGIGGNDAFTLNRPRRWAKEVLGLIELLHQHFPDTYLVFCNMPPIKEFPAFSKLIKFVIGNLVEILGNELDKITQSYDYAFYSSEIISLKKWKKYMEGNNMQEDRFFSDGVHPSKLTYTLWAKDLCEKMAGIIRQKAQNNIETY